MNKEEKDEERSASLSEEISGLSGLAAVVSWLLLA